MYSLILVPLDGTPMAERALPYAEAIADRAGARLRLVRATTSRTFPGVDPTEDQVEAVREAEDYLARVVARLSRRGTQCETATPYGRGAQMVLDQVHHHKPDVVVMATRDDSDISRWLRGSVAEELAADSTAPLLVIREGLPEQPAPWPGDRPRLLVALDGSALAGAALPVAIELARLLDGELVLMQAVALRAAVVGHAGTSLAFLRAARFAADDYLNMVSDELERDYPEVPVRIEVRDGEEISAVTSAAADLGAALIVMSTRGRTGLGRLLLGSVAGGVSSSAGVPAVLVPAAAVRDGAPERSSATRRLAADSEMASSGAPSGAGERIGGGRQLEDEARTAVRGADRE